MRRATIVFVLIVVAGSVALLIRQTGNRPPERRAVVDRRPELRKALAEQEAESARSLARYEPPHRHRVDDLGHPAADLLRGLPGVFRVEVGRRAEPPSARIIHLRDWHFVPEEL